MASASDKQTTGSQQFAESAKTKTNTKCQHSSTFQVQNSLGFQPALQAGDAGSFRLKAVPLWRGVPENLENRASSRAARGTVE